MAVVVLFVVRATFFPALTVADCLLIAIPASILGPIGDLVESMLKRRGKIAEPVADGAGGIED